MIVIKICPELLFFSFDSFKFSIKELKLCLYVFAPCQTLVKIVSVHLDLVHLLLLLLF